VKYEIKCGKNILMHFAGEKQIPLDIMLFLFFGFSMIILFHMREVEIIVSII
jgi:hypothetical protein